MALAATCRLLVVAAATAAAATAPAANGTAYVDQNAFVRAASQTVTVPRNGRRTIELHNDLPIPDGHGELLLPLDVAAPRLKLDGSAGPRVVSIDTSRSDGEYGAGEDIDITVEFTAPVVFDSRNTALSAYWRGPGLRGSSLGWVEGGTPDAVRPPGDNEKVRAGLGNEARLTGDMFHDPTFDSRYNEERPPPPLRRQSAAAAAVTKCCRRRPVQPRHLSLSRAGSPPTGTTEGTPQGVRAEGRSTWTSTVWRWAILAFTTMGT